ncbi:MAG: SH3 domain-containing protein [bacterium]|nr:SH3 domain-containing protein [bacterium]MDT8396482.1 SH3 domain-containing protein [bacterium]
MGDLTVMQKQEVAKGAQAIGAMMGRQAKRRAEKLTSPLPTLSFWGKVLAVTAFAASLAFAGLIVLDSSHVAVDRGKAAIVARDTVNVRQGSSAGSGIVEKAHQGDRFSVTGSRGDWTRVRSSDGSVEGWIASSLIDTKTAKTLTLNYEMKGYATALLICMAIVFFALRMKKVPVTVRNGSETMLVNMDK